jgi:hypothetical protein
MANFIVTGINGDTKEFEASSADELTKRIMAAGKDPSQYEIKPLVPSDSKESSKPAVATAMDVVNFAAAPLTSTYYDVVGDPFTKKYWEEKGALKGTAAALGGIIPAVGDAGLNMMMFSGVGSVPAQAMRSSGVNMIRKAGGGLLADFASGAAANVPKLTQKSLEGISGGRVTGEFLKKTLSAKDLATIKNYDAHISKLENQILDLTKQIPNPKAGTTGIKMTSEQLAKVENLKDQITPLQRTLEGLKAERKIYEDKVAKSIGSKFESQMRHTPFIPGMAGVAGGAVQRGAYKSFTDGISEEFGLEGANMYERIKNFNKKDETELPESTEQIIAGVRPRL